MGQHVHPLIALVALGALACDHPQPAARERPAPPPTETVDAGVAAADSALTAELERVVAWSGQRVWGIAIPRGCTPVRAFEGILVYDCRLRVDQVAAFFAFRFPIGQLERTGEARRFEPGTASSGYARMHSMPAVTGDRARLELFRGAAPVDDPQALALERRLRPRAAAEGRTFDEEDFQ